MSDHTRKQIRDAVVASLMSQTDAGIKVYSNRVRPIAPTDCPCLIVCTDEEKVDGIYGQQWPSELQRNLTVIVRAYFSASENIDDGLDKLIAQIELTLWKSRTSSTLDGMLLGPLQFDEVTLEFDGETQDVPVGRANLKMTAYFITRSNDPTNFAL